MSTSSSPISTSVPSSTPSRSIKRSARLLSTRASVNTVTPAPSVPSSFASSETSKHSCSRIERHRWLIQQTDSGQFLASIQDGKPTWATHPLDSLTHASIETASHNLHKLRDFYKIDGIRLEPCMFYAYSNAPTQWFTDYD